METSAKVVTVLLVEDDLEDAFMTQEAFEHHRVANPLHVVRDGVEAMAFLRRTGEHTDAPRPDLILLDLGLPRMDGHEVLAQVKSDDGLRTIPVVVLTTSDAEGDALRGHLPRADAYVTKPIDFQAFTGTVREFDDFFVAVVRSTG
ncbi:response regulator [Umezawaea sp.]|uniref:response regulator n=1 Tax=Umezawaea sp. TaxID=1955258 RepID=UPI002ED4E181